MRKLQHLLYMLLVGMAITAFTACSDDDDYQPAQKVAEDNMGAYFAAANAASEVLTPEEYAARPKVDLKVKRQNPKGDVSIPVVVDKADAVFKVPAAVEFKDGESEATLSVACPGLQALQSYQFSIHLDEAATNPYVKVDGSPVFSYTVMVARWVKVVENATFMYQSDIFPSVKSDIYQLEGQNKFYIENYLGSGINLGFYIIPQDANGTWTASAFSASDRSTWKGIFMPADHYMNDPDGGTYWYLMKDADNWAVGCYDGQYVGDYLAENGYVVLALDALFWGERGRKEYARYDSQQALSANLLQMGMSWGGLIAWDDIRSAEFLASLPQVDKEKVATMGFSMGAHRAWMTMAATDAVKAGAAVCWMNTTDSLMTMTNNQNKGGSAYAMLVPNIRRYMDYPHVASIACPKPMLFTNGKKDKLFPVEGVEAAYDTMRKVWDSQGAGEHLQTKLYDLPHFCSKEIQKAILDFFNKELNQ